MDGSLQRPVIDRQVMILGEESLDAIDEDCLWTDQPMEHPGRSQGLSDCVAPVWVG